MPLREIPLTIRMENAQLYPRDLIPAHRRILRWTEPRPSPLGRQPLPHSTAAVTWARPDQTVWPLPYWMAVTIVDR